MNRLIQTPPPPPGDIVDGHITKLQRSLETSLSSEFQCYAESKKGGLGVCLPNVYKVFGSISSIHTN